MLNRLAIPLLFFATGCLAMLVACGQAAEPLESQGSSGQDAAGPVDASGADTGTTPLELAPCDPPLSVTPELAHVLPHGLAFVVPAGGTGDYELLLTDDSIGTMNADTGAFLAGADADVSARVFVTDAGCTGVAEAEIKVVAPLEVIPGQPQVPPGTAIPFRAEQGSGEVTFTLFNNASGATMDGADYVAGELEGVDTVRVLDLATSEEAYVYVEVALDAELRPTTRWVQVALGQQFAFSVDGGTGDFDIAVTDGLVTFDDGVLTGLAVGTGELVVTDRISGLDLVVPIGVSGPLSSPANRSGDLSDRAVMLAADLDGDGADELILGVDEMDFGAHDSGAVYVYRGTETGLFEEPARVLTSDDKDVRAGRSIALGDFDDDGRLDLALGVPLADPGVNEGGAVRIHAGGEDGLPQEAVTQVLGGSFAGDRLGHALAACDFNADGVDDLVATARRGENRALLKPFVEQGALYLYLGQPEVGLATVPDQIIYGHVLEEGEFVQRMGLLLGYAVSAGDFDGDGACDLAVSTIDWSFHEEGANRQDGAVLLYRGQHAEAGTDGGLEVNPSRIWAANSDEAAGSRFGTGLLMADLNGDGYADVLANQPAHRNLAVAGNSHGVLNAFWGEPLSNHASETPIAVEDADWRLEGKVSAGQFGTVITTGDLGLDGQSELIVGSAMGLDAEGLRPGVVEAFALQEGLGPLTEPTVSTVGPSHQVRYGSAVAVVSGRLAAMASRDDAYGIDVGRPYLQVDGELAGLDLPGIGTGDAYGAAVVITSDLTGDGVADLVVGAPNEDIEGLGINAGVVSIYRGTEAGFETTPAATLQGFRTHTAGDQFGSAVYDLGDVDGDGYGELGVMSATEELPGAGQFGNGLIANGACEYGASNVAALYVFRGTADGAPQAEPAFIVYGLKVSSPITSALGGLDVNGDGLGDIVVGNARYDVPAEPVLDENGELIDVNDQGAVAVYFGQPAAGDGTTIVLCSPTTILTGRQAEGRLGSRLVPMGDLNDDGCDDFAASAIFEEYTELNEGGLHLIYGWGGSACLPEPMKTVFAPNIFSAFTGNRMAGGADIDGDAVPDLVFAEPAFTTGASKVGALWLASGAYLASFPPVSAASWSGADVWPMWPLGVDLEEQRMLGGAKDGRFGESLALIEGYLPNGRALVVVGESLGAAGGHSGGGGAYAFEFVPGSGFDDVPVATFGGESVRMRSQLGAAISARVVAGRPMVAVGGPGSSSVAVDNGAVYVLDLKP